MSQQVWAAQALESFDAVVQATEGFRSRAGQRLMAQQVARTFSSATLGKVDDESGEDAPVRSIAVIQAGTGVGKSLAYCAPAIALALARGTRVLISTATVALQEQLVN
ncbi:MAG: ATP-dependent DNA helicase DinG, partial [Xylophilus sp.]|nr:ATP-dependent DNA helicase DinG [Xylophilus sp.]